MNSIKDVAANVKAFQESLDDARIKRNNYWILLHKIKKEYVSVCHATPEADFSFAKYVDVNYGIVIQFTKDGQMEGSFEISDPAKYTFCLLKHT